MPNAGPWVDKERITFLKLNNGFCQRGTDGARPTASVDGRLYVSTTDEELSRDNGSSWSNLWDVDDVVGNATIRTLGSGTQQAAAGNHGH